MLNNLVIIVISFLISFYAFYKYFNLDLKPRYSFESLFLAFLAVGTLYIGVIFTIITFFWDTN